MEDEVKEKGARFSIPTSTIPLFPPPPLPAFCLLKSFFFFSSPKSRCRFRSKGETESATRCHTKCLYANIVTVDQQQFIYHATFVNFVQLMNNRWPMHKQAEIAPSHLSSLKEHLFNTPIQMPIDRW